MNEPVKTPRKNNALTHEQANRLLTYLEDHRAECAAPTARQLSDKLTMLLGIRLTESNVQSARRALGITKPAPVKPCPECRCKELAAILHRWFVEPSTVLLSGTVEKKLADIAGIKQFAPVQPALDLPTMAGERSA